MGGHIVFKPGKCIWVQTTNEGDIKAFGTDPGSLSAGIYVLKTNWRYNPWKQN